MNWSKNVRNLLSILFQKDPEVRMQGVANIKDHPWFSTIDWNRLINQELKAPFIPKLEDDLDTQNFDREFTECSIES